MALVISADIPGAEVALRILFVLFYVAFLYHALGDIDFRAVCARPKPRRALTELWQRLVCCLQRVFQSGAGQIDIATKERMNEFRVNQARKFMRRVLVLGGPVLFALVVSAELQGYDGDWDEVLRFSYLLIAYILCLGFIRDFLKLTVFRLDISYAAISFLMCVQLFFMVDDPMFVERHRVRAFVRVLVSLVSLDFWKAIPWNIAFSAITCWCYKWNREVLGRAAEHDESAFVFDEVVLCAITTYVSYMVEEWLKEALRVQVVAQNQKRASFRLATYHNDAVFWMSPTFHLLGPAPHLANMLFLGHVDKHLDGRCFADWIATDSDRARFQDFITSEVDPDSLALPSLLHMDLRDSCGRTFPVEVFNSSFLDFDDKRGHLIGLSEPTWHAKKVERTEAGVEANADAIVNWEAPARNPNAAADEIASLGTQSVAASEGARSTTSSRSEVETFVPFLREEGDHTAVRILLDGFTSTVVACSAGFTSLTGPLLSGTDFCDLLARPNDGIGFLRWLQTQANDLKGTDAHGIVPFNVRLAGPALQRADPVRRRKKKKTKTLEIHAQGYVMKVREDVPLSDMGVEIPQDGIDEEYDMLCIVELVAAQFERPDQNRRPGSTGPVDLAQNAGVTEYSL